MRSLFSALKFFVINKKCPCRFDARWTFVSPGNKINFGAFHFNTTSTYTISHDLQNKASKDLVPNYNIKLTRHFATENNDVSIFIDTPNLNTFCLLSHYENNMLGTS